MTVDYATANAGATAGADYTAKSGTLTFAPGETAKTSSSTSPTTPPPSRSSGIALNLSGASGATILDGNGLVSIGASDAAAGGPAAASRLSDVIVGEGDGYVDMVVSLSAPGQNPVTRRLRHRRQHGRRRKASDYDYVTSSGTLNFAPGETTKAVRLQILDGAKRRGLRVVHARLSSTPVNATIAGRWARVGIVDNDTVVDTPAAVRARRGGRREGRHAPRARCCWAAPTGEASDSTVTVDYATANAGATAGADYTAASGTLTFAPGETVKTVVVDITDDADAEPLERHRA